MSMVARPLVLASILSLLTLLTPLSANAQWSVPWRKAESAHFEVYSDFDERELRSYVDKLEDYDSILRRFDGADPAAPSGPKFKIYLVLGQMDVNAIFPGAPEQTAGLLVNNAQDVYFVDDRRTLMRQFQDVVFRDPIAGWNSHMLVDLTDTTGRTLEAEGQSVSRMSEGGYGLNQLMRWEMDGRIGWGEDQDVWVGDHYARMLNALRTTK